MVYNNDLVEVYKGDFYSKKRKVRVKKVVVLDLDETLGSFVDLEILWSIIHKYKHSISVNFNDILDLYPEFIRYGILSILEYLVDKKKSGECYKVYLYTNNKTSKEWVDLIVNYFNQKFPSTIPLFDQTIYAFKINNVQIELNRTSTRKTHNDFIRCTLLPPTTSICFIDNYMYVDMKTERMYYIKPKSYRHCLTTDEIIMRFIYSRFGLLMITTEYMKQTFKTDFIEKSMSLGSFRSTLHNLQTRMENDILVTQKLMYYLKEYFLITNKQNKTAKRARISFSFTRKRR